MRTTLNIDDDLLKEAKIMAVREGTTLTKFLESAVRDRLGAPAGSASGAAALPAHINPADGVAVTAFLRELARKVASNTDSAPLPTCDATPAIEIGLTSFAELVEALEGPFARP